MTEKKTVSFSSTPLERSKIIISTPDCIQYMQNGSDLIKLASNGRQYKRTYYLDLDQNDIRWFPTTKKRNKAKIALEDILEVRWGVVSPLSISSSTSNSNITSNVASTNITASINSQTSSNTISSTTNTSGLINNSQSTVPSSLIERSFTILYGNDYDFLCLISKNSEEANIWMAGLIRLIANNRIGVSSRTISTCSDGSEIVTNAAVTQNESLETKQSRDKWLHNAFVEADYQNKGFLDELDVIQLMKNLNSRVNTIRIKQKLKEVDINRTSERGRLSSEEFVNLFKEISTRPEIFFLLIRYSSNGEYLSLDDFLFFLEAEQGQTGISRQQCCTLIENYEPTPEGKQKLQLGIDGLTAYLCSPECDIFDKEHLQVCQDMTQPLPHYFIAASYNTYLTEDQLKGPSSVNGFIRALKLGCRFIKMDLWDGPNDEPIIYHGDTLTSKLALRKTLEYIKSYAFISSQYPLMIVIENHCSPDQQYNLMNLLKLIFADTLYVHPTSSDSNEDLSAWPSPEQLKGRILLIGKKLKELEQRNSTEELEFGFVSEEDEYFDNDKAKHHHSNRIRKISTRPRMKLIKQLSDLICFHIERFNDYSDIKRSLSTSNLNLSTSNNSTNTPLSVYVLPEIRAMRLACAAPSSSSTSSTSVTTPLSPNSPTPVFEHLNSTSSVLSGSNQVSGPPSWLLLAHNKDRLTAVYPNPCRVDSSNYGPPQDLWGAGCQLVTLNYQTAGLIMDLNVGFFQKNGSSGYVLKPEIMRHQLLLDLKHKDGIPDLVTQTLHIRVISGQQLPKPRGSASKGNVIDPYVVLQVSGCPSDCAEERTKTVHGNAYNPVFDESFEFEVGVTELALVRFLVLDDDSIGDDFIGQYTVSFECIQTGYRHVNLLNTAGDKLPNAHLFVHIAITNKRGGGKKTKRGRSLKYRNKKYKSQIKKLGIPILDDYFKIINNVLRESFDLRQSFYTAMSSLRDSCNLPQFCNIKQCIRSIINSVNSTVSLARSPTSTINNSDSSPSLIPTNSSISPTGLSGSTSSQSSPTSSNYKPPISIGTMTQNTPLIMNLTQTDKIPKLSFSPSDVMYQIPELVRRSIKCFDELMEICNFVQKSAVPLLEKISESRTRITSEYTDISEQVLTETIKSDTVTKSEQRKTMRIAENFVWNIRLLQGQYDLTNKLIEEAKTCLQSSREVGQMMNMIQQNTSQTTSLTQNNDKL